MDHLDQIRTGPLSPAGVHRLGFATLATEIGQRIKRRGQADRLAVCVLDADHDFGMRIDAVLAMEARGFLLGAPLARALGAGLVPLRKPGKLPGRVFTQAYALEYGEDALQVQAEALPPGARVLLADDVLATGGTLLAAHGLAKQLQAEVVGVSMLIELGFLDGRARWDGDAPLHAALVI